MCIRDRLSSGENYQNNFKDIIKYVNQAIKNKSDLIITPETSSLMSSSREMLFRYSFEMKEEADLIDEAVSRALDAGPRTQDIMASGRVKVGTKGMMDSVINKLEELTK